MRATRVIAPELRGSIEVEGFELKRGLGLRVYTEVLRDRVKVISDEFGCEVLGWNVEDGLGRIFLKLLGMYYEYKDREGLSQEESSMTSEEECIFARLSQYF